MKKIAIIDPSSRSLPYDYYYMEQVSKELMIDFYCSNTSYNDSFLEKIRVLKNVNLKTYDISNTNKVLGIINYVRLLFSVAFGGYLKIHFQWYIFFIVELIFFIFLQKKLIMTFHNSNPHSFRKNFYIPNQITKTLASRIIFVSKFVEDQFISIYGKPKSYQLLQHGVFPSCKSDSISDATVKELIFWGNVKPYKGIDIFFEILKSKKLEAYNLGIYGKWDTSLREIKEKLVSSRCRIEDRFLKESEVCNLLSSKCIFILPYDNASQSGVLYSILGSNSVFVSTDKGDNGYFLKKYGLKELMFDKSDNSSLERAVEFATINYDSISTRLMEIKKDFDWKSSYGSQVY